MSSAARKGDTGSCAIHGPNPTVGGSLNVTINNIPAHRVTDGWSCGASQAEGSPNVTVNSLPAARVKDQGSHGGPIISGSPNVTINGQNQEWDYDDGRPVKGSG